MCGAAAARATVSERRRYLAPSPKRYVVEKLDDTRAITREGDDVKKTMNKATMNKATTKLLMLDKETLRWLVGGGGGWPLPPIETSNGKPCTSVD